MRNRQLVSIALSVVLLLPAAALAQRKGEKNAKATSITDAKAGLEAITAEQMRQMLTFIAADELEGRNTPSQGLDIAAKFLAYNLSRWGFKPAGDNGTFFQKFYLRRGQVEGGQTTLALGTQTFKLGDDLLPRPFIGKAQGKLVYVGHGLVVKAKNVNAYAGIDVKDKIVIAAEGAFPAGVQPLDLNGKLGVDYDTASHYALTHGAKGVLLVPSPTFLKSWDQMKSALTTGRPGIHKGEAPGTMPTAYAGEKTLNALFDGERVNGATVLQEAANGKFTASFELKGEKEATLNVAGSLEILPTQNVVAVWEGSDPALKAEYVALGAHYDHVGSRVASDQGRTDNWSRYRLFLEAAGRTGGRDLISNGADDDGSGTTAVLALAEALTKVPRAKRSILLVWHAGEEWGLWGSEYFTDHPTVPLNQVITQLNIDMIGRSRPAGDNNERNKDLKDSHSIYVIGSKKMSSELGQLSETVNANYLNLGFDYKYDDPNDRERFFYRSDHYNYARKGIPIIFYFNGTHQDYHGVDDEVERIDFERMEKMTRTVFATMWELANRANRVKVDKPLSQ